MSSENANANWHFIYLFLLKINWKETTEQKQNIAERWQLECKNVQM